MNYNYFAQLLSQKSHQLRFPRQHAEDVHRYVRQHQTKTTLERAPFRRQLDFWALSVAVALARGLEPREGPSTRWGQKFVDTTEVEMSKDLCDLLAVAAFHHLGAEHEHLADPAQIVEVGNRLAAVGCPLVLKQLGNPDLRLTPLDKALDYAASALRETSTG